MGWRAGDFLHYQEILHPIQSRSPTEIRDYVFPDLDAEYRFTGVQEEVEQAHQRGLAVPAGPVPSP